MGRAELDLGSWCILRMASADTLRVFKSLSDAGLGVWTPIERKIGRMPRTRTQFDKEAPLMPSYVFGRVEHISELLRLAMIPNRQHPRFSVFRYRDGIPLIADDELECLREAEGHKRRVFEKWRRRGTKGPKLNPGDVVRMTEGAFAGLSGIVEDTQGQFTLVSIDGFHKPIKVASLLLAGSVAQETKAARAA